MYDPQLKITLYDGRILDMKGGKELSLNETVKPLNFYIYKKWQEQWTSSGKGRTTFKFFPSVQDRMKNKKMEINYFTTQVFSGHGNFGIYQKRFKIADSDTCLNCQRNAIDSVESTLFESEAWSDLKNHFEIDRSFFNITDKNAISLKNFSTFVTEVMKIKHKYR